MVYNSASKLINFNKISNSLVVSFKNLLACSIYELNVLFKSIPHF